MFHLIQNKVYPRERDTKDIKFRGRIRVQLRNDDGTPKQEEFPDSECLYIRSISSQSNIFICIQ